MAQTEKKGRSGRKNSDTGNGDGGERFDQLIEHLKALQEANFTGHIKINFSQGGIARIEKFEELFK